MTGTWLTANRTILKHTKYRITQCFLNIKNTVQHEKTRGLLFNMNKSNTFQTSCNHLSINYLACPSLAARHFSRVHSTDNSVLQSRTSYQSASGHIDEQPLWKRNKYLLQKQKWVGSIPKWQMFSVHKCTRVLFTRDSFSVPTHLLFQNYSFQTYSKNIWVNRYYESDQYRTGQLPVYNSSRLVVLFSSQCRLVVVQVRLSTRKLQMTTEAFTPSVITSVNYV